MKVKFRVLLFFLPLLFSACNNSNVVFSPAVSPSDSFVPETISSPSAKPTFAPILLPAVNEGELVSQAETLLAKMSIKDLRAAEKILAGFSSEKEETLLLQAEVFAFLALKYSYYSLSFKEENTKILALLEKIKNRENIRFYRIKAILSILNADFSGSRNFLSQALSKNQQDQFSLYLQGLSYFWESNPNEAEKIFKEILSKWTSLAYVHQELGNVYLKKKRFNDAENEYKSTLFHNPSFFEANIGIGLQYFYQNKFSGAIAEFKKSLALYPESEIAFNYLGKSYLRDRNLSQVYQVAGAEFEKAISLNENYAEAHSNLALMYNKKNELEQGIEHALKAISIKSDFAEAYAYLGLAYELKKDFAKALTNYQKALTIDPECADAYYYFGMYYANKGILEEAIKQLSLAVKFSPGFADYHLVLAELLEKKNHFQQAIEQYELAAEIEEKYAEIYWRIGFLQAEKLGSYDQGISNYQKALVLEPLNIKFSYYLALAYRAIGATDNYFQELDKVTKLGDDKNQYKWQAFKQLAEIYTARNVYDDAIQAYQQAISNIPYGDETLNFQLAKVYLEIEKTNEAINQLEKALKIKPRYPEALDLILDLYFANSRYKDAITLLLPLVEADPDNGELHYQLALAYEGNGEESRSNDHFELACENGYQQGCK